MLIIYKPELKKSLAGIRAQVVYECKGIKDVLWYEVDEKYKDYLTIERADAFLVGLLFYAIKEGEDIEVHAPLSERLFYTINMYLAPIIAEVHGYKGITVFCNELTSTPLKNMGAVGMGFSCGVDSFTTLIDHIGSDCPENYRVTHLTFYNVGSNGNSGGERARNLFRERVKKVKTFADDFGYELITVDSNINEVLSSNFQAINTIRSMSATLILQKLFRCYYYSSSVHLRNFKLSKKDMGRYDIFALGMLSTESLTLFSSGVTKTRVEKTKTIANYKPAHKYLNVCVKGKENCGKCFKCLRTLLTLEVIGEIDKFDQVFNLEAYHSKRLDYIKKVIAEHKTKALFREIYEEMQRQNFKLPPLTN